LYIKIDKFVFKLLYYSTFNFLYIFILKFAFLRLFLIL